MRVCTLPGVCEIFQTDPLLIKLDLQTPYQTPDPFLTRRAKVSIKNIRIFAIHAKQALAGRLGANDIGFLLFFHRLKSA